MIYHPPFTTCTSYADNIEVAGALLSPVIDRVNAFLESSRIFTRLPFTLTNIIVFLFNACGFGPQLSASFASY